MILPPLMSRCQDCSEVYCLSCALSETVCQFCFTDLSPVKLCGVCGVPWCTDCDLYKQCRDCQCLICIPCHKESLTSRYPALCRQCAGLVDAKSAQEEAVAQAAQRLAADPRVVPDPWNPRFHRGSKEWRREWHEPRKPEQKAKPWQTDECQCRRCVAWREKQKATAEATRLTLDRLFSFLK